MTIYSLVDIGHQAASDDLATGWLRVAWPGMIIFVVLVAVGVWLALKDRKRTAALKEGAEPGHWTSDCLDPLNMRTPMFILLDSKGFSLFRTRTGASVMRQWSEVKEVKIVTHKARLKNYAGLAITLRNDEPIDLLFAAGYGKDSYARGAEQALAEFRRRLSEARSDRDQ